MVIKDLIFSFPTLFSFIVLSNSCGFIPHTLISKKDYYELQSPTHDLSISIMSLNILAPIDLGALSKGYKTWYERKNELLSFLHTRSSDFIALQEVTPSVLDELKEEFSLNYRIIENKSYTPDSILLFKKEKFELLEYGWWILEPPFSLNMRRIAVWGKFKEKESGTEIFVASTHLSNPGDKKESEATKLLDYLKELNQNNSALFLAGDFNFDENDPLHLRFENLGWNKTFTDQMKTYPTKKPVKKIDHIFYSLDSISTSFGKIWDTKFFSDHFPLEAHYKINEETN